MPYHSSSKGLHPVTYIFTSSAGVASALLHCGRKLPYAAYLCIAPPLPLSSRVRLLHILRVDLYHRHYSFFHGEWYLFRLARAVVPNVRFSSWCVCLTMIAMLAVLPPINSARATNYVGVIRYSIISWVTDPGILYLQRFCNDADKDDILLS